MKETGEQIIQKNWWGGIWRGLVVDSQAKHLKAMRSAIWLFIYLVIHADRKRGILSRRYTTIAQDMGVSVRTVRHWVLILRKHEYLKIERSKTSAAFGIQIQNWKPLSQKQKLDKP
jgi:hypothetical protein